jgi:hypothetical protein
MCRLTSCYEAWCGWVWLVDGSRWQPLRLPVEHPAGSVPCSGGSWCPSPAAIVPGPPHPSSPWTQSPSAICAAGIRDRLEPAIRPRLTSDRASTFSGYGPGRVAARAGILQEQVVAPGVVIAAGGAAGAAVALVLPLRWPAVTARRPACGRAAPAMSVLAPRRRCPVYPRLSWQTLL